MAEALIEFETLNGEEIKKIVAGEKISRDDDKPKSILRSTVPLTQDEPPASPTVDA